MKKVLLFIAIAASLVSCNSTKSVTKFLTDHHFKETHSINPQTGANKIHASIDSLYDYSKVAALCDTATITFHVSRGSVVADADCSGVGGTLVEVFKKVIANIHFK